jgi:signal transduction histidine kinase
MPLADPVLARATTPGPATSGPATSGPGSQAPWQPPITLWGHAWRLGLALLLSTVVWLPVPDASLTTRPLPLLVADLTLGVVAFGLVLLRRRWPMTIAVVIALFGLVSGTAAGPATLAAVSLATHRRYAQVVTVGVLTVVTAQVWTMATPATSDDPWWLTATVNITFTVAVLALGMFVGSRRELLWTLRERATRAEAEQALRVEQARTTERQRIAREMHDVLGHRISLVGMHAGALAYRHDLGREEVAASARVIEDNARLAMSDLRSVLGVLRGDTDPAPDQPAPTLRDLPALVAEAVSSGTRVDLEERVEDADTMRPGLGRTVYRVVQEGLTNVRKHAPGTRVRVSVTGGPDTGVLVRVENPLPPGRHAQAPRSRGFGIVGLAERAELAGGRLRTRADDGRFVLEVELPW